MTKKKKKEKTQFYFVFVIGFSDNYHWLGYCAEEDWDQIQEEANADRHPNWVIMKTKTDDGEQLFTDMISRYENKQHKGKWYALNNHDIAQLGHAPNWFYYHLKGVEDASQGHPGPNIFVDRGGPGGDWSVKRQPWVD